MKDKWCAIYSVISKPYTAGMQRLTILLWVLFATIVVAMAVYFFWRAQENDSAANTNQDQDCLFATNITEATAVTDWTTSDKIKAADVGQERFEIYDPLANWAIHGRYVAWLNVKTGRSVLNSSLFSDLEFVNITGFGGDQLPANIGTFKQLTVVESDWRSVVLFLITAHIIQTYNHLESDICLAREEHTPEVYITYFTGEHRYCTNECVSEPFSFSVKINKRTGTITVY